MEYDTLSEECGHCLAQRCARVWLGRSPSVRELSQFDAASSQLPLGQIRLPVEDFVDLIAKSGLLPAAELQGIAEAGHADAAALAFALIRDGRLTPWQASKLAKGRCQGFFLNSYKLTGALGNTVYLATHTVLSQQVAIKVAPPKFAHDPALLQRWHECGRRNASLVHPCIARVLNAWNEGPVHFLVRDYIPGSSLRSICEEVHALPPELCCALAAQFAGALAYARRSVTGAVDFDASDLILSPSGLISLLSVGSRAERTMTMLGESIAPGDEEFGEAGAPRLANFGNDDEADVYRIGRLILFMLGARPPLPHSIPEYRNQRSPRDARSIARDILVDLALRFTDPAGKKRVASANDVAKTLLAWLNAYATRS
jgi:hypothetical protein